MECEELYQDPAEKLPISFQDLLVGTDVISGEKKVWCLQYIWFLTRTHIVCVGLYLLVPIANNFLTNQCLTTAEVRDGRETTTLAAGCRGCIITTTHPIHPGYDHL